MTQDFTQNLYKAPQAELDTEPKTQAIEDLPFYPTSIQKLIIMYMGTLGIYAIYWFYKHWKQQKILHKTKIMPFWRAFFDIFFTHSLFQKITEAWQAREKKLPGQTTPQLQGLATIYVILSIAERIMDRATNSMEEYSTMSTSLGIVSLGIMTIVVFPMVQAQRAANEAMQDPEGKINAQFGFLNFLFLFLGSLLWLMFVLDLAYPWIEPWLDQI